MYVKIRDHVGCRTVELSYTRIHFVKKVKYIIYTTTTCYIHTQETRSKDTYMYKLQLLTLHKRNMPTLLCVYTLQLLTPQKEFELLRINPLGQESFAQATEELHPSQRCFPRTLKI